MQYSHLISELEQLLLETYALWDKGWVTFNWRGYTYDHVQRVRGLALTLCEREGGDETVVSLASLLHDVTKPYDGEYVVDEMGKRATDERGFWQNATRLPQRRNWLTDLYQNMGLTGQLHNESGAALSDAILERHGVDAAMRTRVATTIRNHLIPPDDAPLESRCLYDADTIDANIGLPAFVRNIYINAHFYDARRAVDAPTYAETIAGDPMHYLVPYVSDNLPKWGAGKRRDFVPRLLTESARELAVARLNRLDALFLSLGQELDTQIGNGHRNRLSVLVHFMTHRDDPSIADEVAYLARTWVGDGVPKETTEMISSLYGEMIGQI